MSNTITVPVVQVTIRRDAHTINKAQVKPYELTLLRQMFGKENVHSETPVGTQEIDPAAEFDRLCAKYGQPKVVKVFGDDGGERLMELVEKATVKAEKPSRKKAAETAEETAE